MNRTTETRCLFRTTKCPLDFSRRKKRKKEQEKRNRKRKRKRKKKRNEKEKVRKKVAKLLVQVIKNAASQICWRATASCATAFGGRGGFEMVGMLHSHVDDSPNV